MGKKMRGKTRDERTERRKGEGNERGVKERGKVFKEEEEELEKNDCWKRKREGMEGKIKERFLLNV